MRSAYQIHVVFLQEPRHDVWPKCERHSPIVFAPAGDVFVRVRPQEIAKEAWDTTSVSLRIIKATTAASVTIVKLTSIWDIGRSHHTSNLLHTLQIGALRRCQ